MADVRLQGVRKTFGETVAVEALDLDVKDGEFVVLLGPTGAGKTTTPAPDRRPRAARFRAGPTPRAQLHALMSGRARVNAGTATRIAVPPEAMLFFAADGRRLAA